MFPCGDLRHVARVRPTRTVRRRRLRPVRIGKKYYDYIRIVALHTRAWSIGGKRVVHDREWLCGACPTFIGLTAFSLSASLLAVHSQSGWHRSVLYSRFPMNYALGRPTCAKCACSGRRKLRKLMSIFSCDPVATSSAGLAREWAQSLVFALPWRSCEVCRPCGPRASAVQGTRDVRSVALWLFRARRGPTPSQRNHGNYEKERAREPQHAISQVTVRDSG